MGRDNPIFATFAFNPPPPQHKSVYSPNHWGSAAEMFEILPRDWNLKPIFTQKWASVDMNWEVQPQPSPDNSNPVHDNFQQQLEVTDHSFKLNEN